MERSFPVLDRTQRVTLGKSLPLSGPPVAQPQKAGVVPEVSRRSFPATRTETGTSGGLIPLPYSVT